MTALDILLNSPTRTPRATCDDGTIATTDSRKNNKNDKPKSKRGGKRGDGSMKKGLGSLLEELNASSASEFSVDLENENQTCAMDTLDSRVADRRPPRKTCGDRPKRRTRPNPEHV